MKVLVCGSRNVDPFDAWNTIWGRLQMLADERPTVITGGARGPDAVAHRVAKRLGYPVQTFRAQWQTYGKRAGIIRNLAMLDEQPDIVIALWDGKSRGTKHTIDTAIARGIPVEVLTA